MFGRGGGHQAEAFEHPAGAVQDPVGDTADPARRRRLHAGRPGALALALLGVLAELPHGRQGEPVGQGLTLLLDVPLDPRQGRGRLAGKLLLDLGGDELGRNLPGREHRRLLTHRRQDLGPTHRRQDLRRLPARRQNLGSGPRRRRNLRRPLHRRQDLGGRRRGQDLGLERRRRRHRPRRAAAAQLFLALAPALDLEHLPHRQPVVDPGGDLGHRLQGPLPRDRLLRRRGRDRLADRLPGLLHQPGALHRAQRRPEVVPGGLARPVQLEAAGAAELGPDRLVPRDQVRTAALAGVVLFAVPLPRERQPLHVTARIENVRVVVLAAPVRLVQRVADDRLVLRREPVRVGLDHLLGHAGLDQLDRDPHHVVPALPAVLPLVDRLDAVRPRDGVAPARVGPRRGRPAGGLDARPPGVVEEPRLPVRPGDGARRGQALAVAHRAGGRVALGARLHHRPHEGVCHLVGACRRS